MKALRRLAGLLAIASGFGAASLLGWPIGPMAGVALMLCLVGPWLGPRVAGAPWHIVTLGVLTAIGGWVGLGAEPRAALGAALVYLQVHRVLTRTGSTDERVTLLLSGLMLVAAASASEDVIWLVFFSGWFLALPAAMLPSGFSVSARQLRAPLLAVAMVSVLLVTMLFPVLPRVRADAPDPKIGTTGFNETVDLGVLDALMTDPAEAFTVEATPDFPDAAVYFRGSVLEVFDGRSWSSGVTGEVALGQLPEALPGGAVALRFSGIPPSGVLFTAGQVQDVDAPGRVIRRDHHGAYRLDSPVDDVITWTVVAQPPWGTEAALVGDGPGPDAYLQLPGGLDPRVGELAKAIVGEERNPRRMAESVAAYLRTNMDYTRMARDAGSVAPLSTFLFDRRSGHCEYYASAAAVLLRSLGLQTRVVNGFVSGEPNPLGPGRIVRRYHAHSWTEMYEPGRGWILIDATPGPGAPSTRPWSAVVGDRLDAMWRDSILGFDRVQQKAALWSAGAAVESAVRRPRDPSAMPWTGIVILWLVCLFVALVLDRALRRVGARLAGEMTDRPRSPVERAWRSARGALEARTGSVPASLPPLTAARILGERCEEAAGPLEELAWLHYRVLHAGEDPSTHTERARQLARVVQETARRATG